MDLSLTNKVVWVAGSSRGIGRAMVERFLEEGARVVISARNLSTLTSLSRKLQSQYGSEKVFFSAGDLTRDVVISVSLKEILKKWGKLDCVVANIGNGAMSRELIPSKKDWEDSIDVNLMSSVRLAHHVIPYFKKRKSGSLVTISSIVGLESLAAPLSYSAAKSALINYTKNLSRRVGAHGVRVNCVAPGNIYFSGGRWEKLMKKNRKKITSYINQEVPLMRFGTADEIADLVVFLSSSRASFITGSCVVADGGQSRLV